MLIIFFKCNLTIVGEISSKISEFGSKSNVHVYFLHSCTALTRRQFNES